MSRLLRAPNATASIYNAIVRHENNGEVVTRIVVSHALHNALVSEAWEWCQVDIGYITAYMNIPVVMSQQLNPMDFMLDTEKRKPLNDA